MKKLTTRSLPSPRSYSPGLFAIVAALGLSACTTMTKPETAKQAQSEREAALLTLERQVSKLLLQLSSPAGEQQLMSRVSDCRYELSSQWSSPQRQIYQAQNRIRFSFTHDLRAVDHSLPYVVKDQNGWQHWDERVVLAFNRDLPIEYSYFDPPHDQRNVHPLLSNNFSFGNFSGSNPPLLALQTALTAMAALCQNDLSATQLIAQKVVGRWRLKNETGIMGGLVLTPQWATLQYQDELEISGPYTIIQEQDHFRLIISPPAPKPAYTLLLDFHTSNQARLLLVGDFSGPVAFTPLTAKEDTALPQLNLIRLGDLR